MTWASAIESLRGRGAAPKDQDPRRERSRDRRQAVLESSRRVRPDQCSHDQATVEAAGVGQQPFQNDAVAAQKRTHPARFDGVGKAAFEPFAPLPAQGLPRRALDT